MATIGSITTNLRLESAAFQRDLRRSTRAMENSARQMQRQQTTLERGFAGMNRAVGAVRTSLVSLGVVFGGTAIVGGLTSLARSIDEVVKSADRVGVTVEALQELRLAAELAGVQGRTLDLALQRFSRRVGEAAQGTGELKDTLELYNISVRDSSGRIRSQEAILSDLAEAIRNAESEQERLRIAFKAFDSEGARLVELLRSGSAGLEAMRQQARQTGNVVSDETARSVVEFNDKITILDNNIKGALLPVLESTITALREFNIITTPRGQEIQQRLGDIQRLIEQERTFLESEGTALGFFDQILGRRAQAEQRINDLLGERRRLLAELRLRAERESMAASTVAGLQVAGGGAAGGGGGTPPAPQIIPPAPMSRAAAQSFDLQVIARLTGGAEAYADSLDELRAKAQEAARGQQTLADSTLETERAFQTAMEGARIFASTASSGIVNAVRQAESFVDAFKNITTSIAEAVAQMLLFQAIMSAIGSPTGGIGGGPSGLFALFGGGRAHGGPVDPGRAFLVGERGPELFQPAVSGRIIPGDHLRTAAAPELEVHVHNNARGAEVDVQQDAQGRVDITVSEIMAREVRPGTPLDRALRQRYGLSFQTQRR